MTSQEIANLANVSRSTVSRVINNYPNVPEKTRIKIQAIIDKYGYTPNPSARTLAGKCQNIIGLFIADIDNTNSSVQWLGANSPYNSKLIAKIIDVCKKRGYMLLVNTLLNFKEFNDIKNLFESKMISGGIFVGFPQNVSELSDIMSASRNIVLIDQLTATEAEDMEIKTIDSSNILGGNMATNHLINNGHRIIAHITGDNRLSSIEREQGYRKALADNNISIDESIIVRGEYREEVSYNVTKTLLQNKDITAIFVANDIMALGCIRAIKELNLRIPEDISIVGFDNLEAEAWFNLGLTTLEVPMDKLAENSVSLLLGGQKGRMTVTPKVIERSSVKKLN